MVDDVIRGQIAADPVHGFRMAEDVKKVRTLKSYLCSAAYPKNFDYHSGYETEPNVDACRNCEAQCGFGKRLIELMGG